MPIPKYDQLLWPIWALATKQDITIRTATNAMADRIITPLRKSSEP